MGIGSDGANAGVGFDELGQRRVFGQLALQTNFSVMDGLDALDHLRHAVARDEDHAGFVGHHQISGVDEAGRRSSRDR